MSAVPDEHHDGHRGVVRPEVVPPGSLDATRLEFHDATTVRQAAIDAARELGYRTNDPGFQNADRVQLNPDQTLAQAGVNDGYVLYLIDTAGGQ